MAEPTAVALYQRFLLSTSPAFELTFCSNCVSHVVECLMIDELDWPARLRAATEMASVVFGAPLI
jgi:hypothetical protein